MSISKRAFALVFALLFLVTSVGFSIAILLEDDGQDGTNQSVTANSSNDTQTESEDGKLQGSKLADFTPVSSVDKLQTIDLVDGNGEIIRPGATVTAHYTGALAADGTIFQSSHDFGQPIPFGLNQVIPGWTEGVPGMRVGGKRRLIIPYEKAYGEQGTADGSIPPKADLVFDIEVVSVEQ